MADSRRPAIEQISRRPGFIHLAVLFVYAVLTIAMTWPLARYAASAIPGDGFDGWQNYWNLWWLKTAVVDRVISPFYTDMLYAPTGVGLYFHTLNPINGLMTMPVQLVAGLIPAYNAVVLVSWVLAGYGAFLLCLWTLRPIPARLPAYAAAFTAGLIYTFAPFHMAHLLGHMQVMSLQWIPFYILFLLRALARSRSRKAWLPDALLAGLFLIFNGLSDWYFVLYLFLFTGLAVVYFWLYGLVISRRSREATPRRALQALIHVLLPPLTAGALFVLVLSPVLVPMVREAMQFSFMVRPVSDLYILSASLADFAIPSRLHSIWRDVGQSFPGNQIAPVSERTISVGYAVLGLALLGIALRRKRALFWLVSAVFFLLISLGPELHLGNITWESVPGNAEDVMSWTPFGILNRIVPFARISRSVSRYALMVQLSAAILAGLGLHALLSRLRRPLSIVVGVMALVVILFEFWVVPYPVSPPDTPAIYWELADGPDDGAVLNLPMNYDRPGYLLYQTVHGRPLTVAYISRDDPRTLTERVPVLQHFRHLGPDILADDPVKVSQTVLSDLGVEFVALDRYKMPGGDERAYTEGLAVAIFAGQDPYYEDERMTVYRIQPAEQITPYLQLGPLHWRPLQTHGRTGITARTVGEGPACVIARHAPEDANIKLEYWTEMNSDGVVLDGSGRVAAELPAAADGASVIVSANTDGGSVGDLEFCVIADVPGSVFVSKVSLLE